MGSLPTMRPEANQNARSVKYMRVPLADLSADGGLSFDCFAACFEMKKASARRPPVASRAVEMYACAKGSENYDAAESGS